MTQNEYVEILFNDCGFTPTQRRAWLRTAYGKAYPDELPAATKHLLVERLKALKQAQREAAGIAPAREEESGLLFEET